MKKKLPTPGSPPISRNTRLAAAFRRHGRSGAALVMSLIFIVIITIALLGFVATAKFERRMVGSHFGKMQAGLYNAMATEIVTARLREFVSDDAAWLTAPGRVARIPFVGGSADVGELHSGEAMAVIDDVSVDLNPKTLVNSRGIMEGDSAVTLPVKWVYVREDGTHEVAGTTPPVYIQANPVLGRYAFWADDESSRVNWNTAAAPLPTPPPSAPAYQFPGHPTDVSLVSLDIGLAAVKTVVEAKRAALLFDSRDDVKSVVPPGVVDDLRLDVTIYNHTPELNLFNEPRIVLTTQKRRADGAPFLDILNSDNAEPGLRSNFSEKPNPTKTKYNEVFDLLYGYMARTDWPIMPGKSFVQKYGAVQCAQIVMNIIDYVRSAESAMPSIEAARLSFDAVTKSIDTGSSFGTKGMMATSGRRLMITQMGVWFSDTPNPGTGRYDHKYRVEVYYPKSGGDPTDEIDLTANAREMFCTLRVTDGTSSTIQLGGDWLIAGNASIAGGGFFGGSKIKPGEYRTITMPNNPNIANNAPPARPGTVELRVAIRLSGDAGKPSEDISPIYTGEGTMIKYTVDPPGTSVANITSVSTIDPFANKARADFNATPQGASTFGTTSATLKFPGSTVGNPVSSILPQQDGDAGGKVTDVGIQVAARKGSSKNLLGLVQNVAELGRISTGAANSFIPGVPYRSLRLQPRKATDDSLPDWLLLDLFTVCAEAKGMQTVGSLPATPAAQRERAALQPHTNTIAGLINVNSSLYPFDLVPGQIKRTAPMVAAIKGGVPTLSDVGALAAAENIATHTLATGANAGRNYGPAALENLYMLPAQIAEIKGVADGGEASELDFQKFYPLLTNRGSVFAVYAIGQKIRQLPNGRIVVLGESRTRTALEAEWQYERDTIDNHLIVPLEVTGLRYNVVSTEEIGTR